MRFIDGQDARMAEQFRRRLAMAACSTIRVSALSDELSMLGHFSPIQAAWQSRWRFKMGRPARP